MTAKRPPKMKVDPLQKYTAARRSANATSRATGAKGKGTFSQGTKSANSSNGQRRSSRTGRFV